MIINSVVGFIFNMLTVKVVPRCSQYCDQSICWTVFSRRDMMAKREILQLLRIHLKHSLVTSLIELLILCHDGDNEDEDDDSDTDDNDVDHNDHSSGKMSLKNNNNNNHNHNR